MGAASGEVAAVAVSRVQGVGGDHDVLRAEFVQQSWKAGISLLLEETCRWARTRPWWSIAASSWTAAVVTVSHPRPADGLPVHRDRPQYRPCRLLSPGCGSDLQDGDGEEGRVLPLEDEQGEAVVGAQAIEYGHEGPR